MVFIPQQELSSLFESMKTILTMCASWTLRGFILDALQVLKLQCENFDIFLFDVTGYYIKLVSWSELALLTDAKLSDHFGPSNVLIT